MQVEQWSIHRVIPYASNAWRIPKKAMDKVAASIGECKFRQPIVVLVHEVIIAGHVRLLAARKPRLETLSVHVAGLTEEQVKAYRLMDNSSHEESGWNLELLPSEILEIDSRYVDVMVCKCKKIAGRQALLAGEGRTFEQVQSARKLAGRSFGKGNDNGTTKI